MSQHSLLSASRLKISEYGPGILLSFTIAAAATFLSEHYTAPVMLFALLIGMAFHFLSTEGRCQKGIQFTASHLLRIGVALLGARVTMEQIMSLGTRPLILVPILIVCTIACGLLLARVLKHHWTFGLLTGGAVAICGASAALAIAAVLPKTADGEQNTLFTVITVTALSTLAMIVYPIAYAGLGFEDRQIGMLLGATIHDVAQVVGAGYAVSEDAGNVATYVKLLRVAMLPIVVILIALCARSSSGTKAPFPWFAVAFAVILWLNSSGLIPPWLNETMSVVSRWLLVAAIAALGIKTSIKAMTELGGSCLLLVVLETLALFALATAALMIWM